MGKRALGTYFILSYWGLLLKGLNGSNGSNLIPTLYLRYLPYSLYLIPDTYLTSLMGFAYGQKGTWHLRLCFFFFQTGALTSYSLYLIPDTYLTSLMGFAYAGALTSYSLYLIPDTYLTSLMGFAYGQKGTWHLRLCFFFFQTGALTSCSSCYWGLLLTLKCIGVIYIYVH